MKINFEKFDASSEIRKCAIRDLVRFEPGSINDTKWHPYYTTTRPPMPMYKTYTIRYLYKYLLGLSDKGKLHQNMLL